MRQLKNHIDIFACPACGGHIQANSDEVECTDCRHHFPVEAGIPLLFWRGDWPDSKKDVTDIVKSFYEKTPFPNYDGVESVNDLMQKAHRGVFARLLNEQVPFNIRVLEVGCGTGQLTNYLGISHRFVFGADMCLNSLRLGQDFQQRNNLDRVGFYQMNLFKPIFKEESFPIVICNGVLHHTSDAYGGFQSIARLVKRGGYILIGLYNRFGRKITDGRRMIFNAFNDRFKFLDPWLRGQKIGDVKTLTWFMDQYKHPHESEHSIGEVIKWFHENGFEFVNSIPKAKAFQPFSGNERLFAKTQEGNWLDHIIVQSQLVLTGSKEGGLFIMIGKRVV